MECTLTMEIYIVKYTALAPVSLLTNQRHTHTHNLHDETIQQQQIRPSFTTIVYQTETQFQFKHKSKCINKEKIHEIIQSICRTNGNELNDNVSKYYTLL